MPWRDFIRVILYAMEGLYQSHIVCHGGSYCMPWRVILCAMEGHIVCHAGSYCMPWRVILYAMEGHIVCHGGSYYVPWRVILCAMQGHIVCHGGSYCMLWRVILCAMQGLYYSSESYCVAMEGHIVLPWRDFIILFILFYLLQTD